MFSICMTAEQKTNAGIAREMKQGEQAQLEKISVLILGTGDSGKTSTLDISC
jgi:hypothetical protein